MNKHLIALASTLLIAGTSSAYAASTVDLTVKGIITPNACTPTLSGGGVIDHGKMSAKDLNQTTPTQLPSALLQMTVTCDAQTAFALKATDNRNDPSSADNVFTLKMTDGTQKIGGYNLNLNTSLADGAAVRNILSVDSGTSWTQGTTFQRLAWLSVAALTGPSTPRPTQQLITELQYDGFINRADGLDLSNEVNFEGSATIEVMYL